MKNLTVIPWEDSKISDFCGMILYTPGTKKTGDKWQEITKATYKDWELHLEISWTAKEDPRQKRVAKVHRVESVVIKPLSRGPVYFDLLEFGIRDRETLLEYTIYPPTPIRISKGRQPPEEFRPNKIQPKRRR